MPLMDIAPFVNRDQRSTADEHSRPALGASQRILRYALTVERKAAVMRRQDADDLTLDEHIASPYHRGILENATATLSHRNPVCGDEVCLQVMVVEGIITAAWFQGRGCIISQAAASMLCETIEGSPLKSLKQFTPEQMLMLIGIPLTPARRGCGLLALETLHRLLQISFAQEPFRLGENAPTC